MQCISCLLLPAVLSFAPPEPAAAKATVKKVPEETTVCVDGYAEAVDALGKRLLNMSKGGKVLCIWLFDESESMKDDQKEVRDRIPKLYAVLKQGGADADSVVSAVASYGEHSHFHSKRPTSNVDAIQKQMDRIPVEKSGKEYMCDAVGRMIKHHRRAAVEAERQMVLALVSDESGDPLGNRLMESALDEAKEAGCRVFVFGREAVFGGPYDYLPWIDPRTKFKYTIRIDRGPETPYPEALLTDGFGRPPKRLGSGFGPYEQSRLAQQTGGAFFMLPSVNTALAKTAQRNRDRETLRKYAPSLEERTAYLLAGSRLRMDVLTIIKKLNPYDVEGAKFIKFRTRFAIDPKRRETQIDEELRRVRFHIRYFDARAEQLEERREERTKESLRGRANYDLLCAQLVAYRIRIGQLGRTLTAFRKEPKKPVEKAPDPRKTDTFWEVNLRKEIIEDADEPPVEKQIERATKLLERVIQQHKGTPWSARAQWELSRGYGVELRQVWERPRPKDPIRPPPL